MAEPVFPIGRRINLPGHFAEPVVLESIRAIGDGFECRVRLSDGTPDEAILSLGLSPAFNGAHWLRVDNIHFRDYFDDHPVFRFAR